MPWSWKEEDALHESRQNHTPNDRPDGKAFLAERIGLPPPAKDPHHGSEKGHVSSQNRDSVGIIKALPASIDRSIEQLDFNRSRTCDLCPRDHEVLTDLEARRAEEQTSCHQDEPEDNGVFGP